jgi:hypothetical protein
LDGWGKSAGELWLYLAVFLASTLHAQHKISDWKEKKSGRILGLRGERKQKAKR